MAHSSQIVVRLEGGRVVGVSRVADGRETPVEVGGGGACEVLARLAAERREARIAWLERELEPRLLPVARWPALLRHDLDLLHLGLAPAEERAVASLGLVDFDSPFVLPRPAGRPYASWLISPRGGIASAAALRAAGVDRRLASLPLALLDLGRRGAERGLCPRVEPRLWRDREADGGEEAGQGVRGHQLAALIRRGYGRKWLAFWLLGRLLHERRPPLVAALRGALAPAPPPVDEAALAALAPPPGPVPAGRQALTAVVPTLGRPESVAELLHDLAAQGARPARVVVVEQRPEPPHASELGALAAGDWPFELRLLTVPWAGACRARNRAFDELAGDWVLLLDDDVRLRAFAIARLIGVARAYGVAAVNACVHLPQQDPAALAGGVLPRPWPAFASGAALVARPAVEAAGGFDPRLDGGFGEDYDFGLRLRRAGGEVLYDPGTPVEHRKAPAGGLRSPYPHPWRDDPLPPKPSPTVLLSRRLHHPPAMLLGYKLFYHLGRLRRTPPWRWPAEIRRLRRQWRSAQRWCDHLNARGPMP
ncbi:MAG: glycosyltransferase family 2 protein [Acidobacteria bacterium]|nr:MAG: glycosyltransferase family 2 protein [Acidobacteriota bacterium]